MADFNRIQLDPQLVKDKEIRACQRCDAWISNDRKYGRLPNPANATLCECCTVDSEADWLDELRHLPR